MVTNGISDSVEVVSLLRNFAINKMELTLE